MSFFVENEGDFFSLFKAAKKKNFLSLLLSLFVLNFFISLLFFELQASVASAASSCACASSATTSRLVVIFSFFSF